MPECDEEIHLGELVISAPERSASVRGRPLTLTTREFDILLSLAARPGWVFSADQLSFAQSPQEYASAGAVNVHISRIRAKLAAAGCEDLLETVRGIGWRLKKPPSEGRALVVSFVGRARELARLLAGLSESGVFLLVTGEPGIGKTALVEEALCRVQGDRTIIRAVCDGNGSGDYWMWRQLSEGLGMAAPGIGSAVQGEVRPEDPNHGVDRTLAFAMFTARLTEAVGSARYPVLFIDDLQWADDASLKLLSYVLKRLADIQCTIVSACRDADARTRAVLAAVTEFASASPRGRLITLTGMDSQEVAALAGSLGIADDPLVVEELISLTDGNPLFVRHCAESLARGGDITPDEHGSASLASLVRAQTRLLPEAVTALLQMAACAGIDFEPSLIEGAPDSVDPDWGAALSTGILVRRGERLSFKHALVREALRESIAPEQQEAIHAALAGALRNSSSAERSPSRLAHHYGLAGHAHLSDAIGFHCAAARGSTVLLAYEDAASHLKEALGLLDRLPLSDGRWRRVRAVVLEREGAAWAALGESKSALDLYARALSLRSDDDVRARVRLLTKVAYQASGLRQPARCFDSLTAALRLLEDHRASDPGWWHAWIQVQLAHADGAWMMNVPDNEEFGSLEQLVIDHGSPEQRSRYYIHKAERLAMRDDRWMVNEQSVQAARQAVREAESCGEFTRAYAIGVLGNQLIGAGEIREAEYQLRLSVDLARRCGDTVGTAASLFWLATAARLRGDVLATEALARELEALVADHASLPEFRSGVDGHLAWVALRREQFPEAAERSTRALAVWLEEPSCSQSVWMMAWPAVVAALERGEERRAFEAAALMVQPWQEVLQGGLADRLRDVCALEQRGEVRSALDALRSAAREARSYGYA